MCARVHTHTTRTAVSMEPGFSRLQQDARPPTPSGYCHSLRQVCARVLYTDNSRAGITCRVARDRRTDHKQSGEVCRRTLGLGMSTRQASLDCRPTAGRLHTQANNRPKQPAARQAIHRCCCGCACASAGHHHKPCAPAIPLHELRAAMRHALRDCVQFRAHCRANSRPVDCQAIKRNDQQGSPRLVAGNSSVPTQTNSRCQGGPATISQHKRNVCHTAQA